MSHSYYMMQGAFARMDHILPKKHPNSIDGFGIAIGVNVLNRQEPFTWTITNLSPQYSCRKANIVDLICLKLNSRVPSQETIAFINKALKDML